jgi:hypothetical protein
MLYLDLFDSVKTAHTEEVSSEWWRPHIRLEQEHSRELARAEMMVRLLHGDTIVLSNNQATDSVGWLQLAEDFSTLNMTWEPIAMAVFGTRQIPTNDSLLEMVINYFKDKNFKLSAWVGVDLPLRNKVVENLQKHPMPRFDLMFEGVTSSLDKRVAEDLNRQAVGLQKFYEYLTRNKEKEICFPASIVGDYLWPRMKAMADQPDGIQSGELKHIKQYLEETQGPNRVEYRSALYQALDTMDEPRRTHIRKYVDRFYNEKMGLSVSKGKGVYTFTDHDPNTPVDLDSRMDAQADRPNDPEGILGQVVLSVDPKKIKYTLKWDEFLRILSDKEFGHSSHFLRMVIRDYDYLNPQDLNYHSKYTNWLGRTFDALNKHQDLLATMLGKEVAKRNASTLAITIGTWTGAALDAVLASQIHYVIGVGAATGAVLSKVLEDRFKKSPPQKLVTSAAGRIRTSLKESVTVKSDEELLK